MSMLAFTVLFSKSWQMNSYVFKTGQESSMISQTINTMVKKLRKVQQADDGEYPLKSASDNDLVVFITWIMMQLTKPKRSIILSNSQLKMGISYSSGNPASYPSTDTTVTTLASNIVNDASNPVFTYYNNNIPETLPTIRFRLRFPVQTLKMSRLVKFI